MEIKGPEITPKENTVAESKSESKSAETAARTPELGQRQRRVSTALRQKLTEFSEFFVFDAHSRFLPQNFASGSCRSDDRRLA
jgi:hypothetical protein